jgi:NADH dehydrogenase
MAGTVTIFGGTGFLGRRVVLHLCDKGFSVRVASRHPERGREHFGRDAAHLRLVRADIHDDGSVAEAIAGADGVVNAVSLYVEHGKETFRAVHVEAAERVARQAHKAGIKQLVHVSGIGSDANSRSKYIKARGQGELAVRSVFSDTTLIRPAVMFGPDDAFLTTLLGLLRRLPVYPMFGRGETRLQPAYVEDVSEAIARSTQRPEAKGTTFECGGPRIYSYEELLRNVARVANIRVRLMPIPFAAWHMLAQLAKWLPSPPIARNQVELMEMDTVATPGTAGFAELGIAPRSLEEVLETMVRGR